MKQFFSTPVESSAWLRKLIDEVLKVVCMFMW